MHKIGHLTRSEKSVLTYTFKAINSSLAVVNSIFYVSSTNGSLYSLYARVAASGSKKWSYQMGVG